MSCSHSGLLKIGKCVCSVLNKFVYRCPHGICGCGLNLKFVAISKLLIAHLRQLFASHFIIIVIIKETHCVFISLIFFNNFNYRNFLKSGVQPYGIHVLRQNPFETLISFLCSVNNAIFRIVPMIEKLCIRFGQKVSTKSSVTWLLKGLKLNPRFLFLYFIAFIAVV